MIRKYDTAQNPKGILHFTPRGLLPCVWLWHSHACACFGVCFAWDSDYVEVKEVAVQSV